ncbi:MAG: hypothetical protein WD030_04870 [Pirellulales bacterium]
MSETQGKELAALDEASQSYIGQWNQLVSSTNWEKGRIIHQWRTALQADGAPAAEYTDNAWSERVGNVTGQHVGRLRRVYERFGTQRDDFRSLYWSHFQAALDWEDAEMYLEGAAQNGWSVSQMRRTRWEAMGAPAELKPRDEDIITGEVDEDVDGRLDRQAPTGDYADEAFEPDFGDESPTGASQAAVQDVEDDEQATTADAAVAKKQVRPFADLAALPEDLAEAFESFKLAILHHKLDGWRDVSRDDLVATLEALKELALADSGA